MVAVSKAPRTKRWKIFLILFLGTVVFDQVSKYWAVAELTRVFEVEQASSPWEKISVFFTAEKLERIRTRPLPVFEDYWHFKYVENPGAAWGMFGGLDDSVRVPFFFLTTTIAIGAMLLFLRRIPEDQRMLQVALSLVLGGAIGNLIDRLARGYVIDFIDWHWKNQPNLHWPTFNIADIAISIGVGMLLAESLFPRRAVAGTANSQQDVSSPDGGESVCSSGTAANIGLGAGSSRNAEP